MGGSDPHVRCVVAEVTVHPVGLKGEYFAAGNITKTKNNKFS